MAEIKYQKLARARSRSFIAVAVMTRTSLWLGPDHLLFIESSGYTENYKRFYFRDIQALSVCRTDTATTIGVVLGFLTVVFLLLSFIVRDQVGFMVVLLILAASFGAGLILNIIGGASCKCHIKTAVQTEELSALARLRKARKVLDRIRPLITEAQGGALSPEMVFNLMRSETTSASTVSPSVTVAQTPSGIPPRLEP